MIESVKSLFIQRGEKEILLNSAKIFQQFIKAENPFLERTLLIFSVLVDQLQDKFNENFSAVAVIHFFLIYYYNYFIIILFLYYYYYYY